ncbi:MAG TPA: BsuPI-related putative proteinase inhibitor [Candidatus Aquicultor sp.]|jgi:hypothetical protein
MPRPRIFCFAVIVIGLLLVSCTAQNKADNPSASKPTSASGTVGVQDGDNSTVMVADIKVSAKISSENVRPGQRLKVTLNVLNTASQVRELTFNTGQKYDLLIKEKEGRNVWRWSAGKMFSQMIETVRLGPGKSVSYEAEWPGTGSLERPLKPGTYTVTANITANDLRDKELTFKLSVAE